MKFISEDSVKADIVITAVNGERLCSIENCDNPEFIKKAYDIIMDLASNDCLFFDSYYELMVLSERARNLIVKI